MTINIMEQLATGECSDKLHPPANPNHRDAMLHGVMEKGNLSFIPCIVIVAESPCVLVPVKLGADVCPACEEETVGTWVVVGDVEEP